MLLSIIIVNYNVKYFLEQCLCSVEKALREAGLEFGTGDGSWNAGQGRMPDSSGNRGAEIFVVDNHSSDGSAEWLPGRFPDIQFILNTDNKGFGAANNQALARAKGKYILFLNPDTILPEDALSVCLCFMGSHEEAGAVGLRMIDGRGRFLKESRRGYPSPWVALCKMTGLTALFPRSAVFAKYYLGQLPPSEDHPAPILPGAFMFVRAAALDKTGGFDERFFLYAEDIDLSYRIEQAGYRNYYLAGATILHFKGESTKKDARYIRLFYKAMSQFRRKHARGIGSRLFNVLLEGAIWGRAGIQVLENAFRRGDRRTSDIGGIEGSDNGGEEGITGAEGVTGAEKITGAGEEIIFNEGPDLSFKKIIESMREDPRRSYKIHAAGSSAAVGSHSYKIFRSS